MQLGLLDYRPPVALVAPVSVTHMLWEAAGRPTAVEHATSAPAGSRCWWCGHRCPHHPDGGGWARPRAVLPDTFPFPADASAPRSEWLCLPCGWTLSDRVALPGSQGADKIAARCAKGGRLIVSVRGAPARRWLVLQLADGTVGLWEPATNVAGEEGWTAALGALRTAPADVGPCRFVDAVPLDALQPEATEKFRSYHHLAHGPQPDGTPARWWPCTDTQRLQIRDWLLAPPAPPWVCVIGDGKKHAAVAAQLLDAVTTSAALCVVYHRGDLVAYRPEALARVISAVEALVSAGAGDDEIATGGYAPRSLALLLAIRGHDRIVAPYRGGPVLPLATYLRRNRAQLAEESP